MKKDAFYFPHYSNARHDRKIQRLCKDLGVEGYGIYFMILEILREQLDFRYPMKDLDLISDELKTSIAKVEAVINVYDLFEVDQAGNFFSPKFVVYLQPWLQKKEQMRKAVNARWEKARETQPKKIEAPQEPTKPNCFKFYEDNINGCIAPSIAEQINSYLNDGIEDELISKCMAIACEQEKRSWSYIKAILERCITEGTKTLKQFELKQQQYKNSNQKKVDNFVKQNGRLPNYANFEQREYTEEEMEGYYITARKQYKKEETA
jgi:DnaD/phage-associated family protein